LSADSLVDEAVAALRRGELVCFPTETTYGLAADIDQPAALERLVRLKGRDLDAPFGLIVADQEQAMALARAWPSQASSLAARHWPGPLTMVVPARGDLPPEIVGAKGGVGVRVSSHPLAAALAQGLGRPITATSANPSGAEPALSAAAARAYFGAGVAVYLDDGPSNAATASTLVEIGEDGQVRVLRRGEIPLEDLDTAD